MTTTFPGGARGRTRPGGLAQRRQKVLDRRVGPSKPASKRSTSNEPTARQAPAQRRSSTASQGTRAGASRTRPDSQTRTVRPTRRKLTLPALPKVSLRPTPPPGAKTALGPASPPTLAFYLIVVLVIMLTTIGLVMVLSASSITQFHSGYSPWRVFGKQAMWAVVGAMAAVAAYRIPYQRWRAWTGPFMVVSAAAMLLPFVPGLGRSVNSARAWVEIGPATFQPSEVLKIAVLMRCADLLARQLEQDDKRRPNMMQVLQVLVVTMLLCVAQGDLGAVAVFAAIGLTVAFIAGVRLRPMVATMLIGSAFFAVFVISSSRRIMRWTAFMDLEGNKEHYAYQVWQSMLSIANGGPTGVGIGAGTGKWGYVPLAHTDFIFAIVAEELGLMGALAVIGGFIVLTVAGIQVALAARDRFGMLLAGGIAGWFSVQAFINVGGVTGLLPVTGLTLPLISYGGSSLLVSLAAAGLLANVARHVT